MSRPGSSTTDGVSPFAMSRRKKLAGDKLSPRIKILFVAGFGPIVRDGVAGQSLYAKTLGIAFEEAPGGYLHTEELVGVKHFALWPLAQASESCFGTEKWPDQYPIPQAWAEFDVEDIQAATDELRAKGYQLLVNARKEPWGQTVTRFLDPNGLLIGITHTPWMRTPDSK
jgi:catechol 2,3-dioxygenase-like lactoylglutathione lyase family enzyme